MNLLKYEYQSQSFILRWKYLQPIPNTKHLLIEFEMLLSHTSRFKLSYHLLVTCVTNLLPFCLIIQ